MKKHIDPVVSILIVMAVFAAVTFFILEGETALNNQLRASILNSRDDIVKTSEMSECLEDAYNDFLTNWNQKCKDEELEEKCSLEKEIAKTLKANYQTSQNNCY